MQLFGQMEMIETGLMNPKDGAFTMGFERFNALLTWREYPDGNFVADAVKARVKR